MYCVEVDWAPAFELLVSLKAFANTSDHKLLDLGTEWVREVRHELPGDLVRALGVQGALFNSDVIDLLIYRCPADRSAAGFVGWLADLSPGEIYECVVPELRQGRQLLPESPSSRGLFQGQPPEAREGGQVPGDLAAERDRWVGLLDSWSTFYFRNVDPAILTGLEADAAQLRKEAQDAVAEELVERATNGVQFLPEPLPEIVLLVPQYHYRPWNIFDAYRWTKLIQYPADVVLPEEGEPPAGLLRLTRAISDPSRLRILRYLSTGSKTFTEIAKTTALAKSTVHHHMVALRAAGLVRVRVTGAKSDVYSLRPGAIERLGDALDGYLTSGK